jgi:hypothetical protein
VPALRFVHRLSTCTLSYGPCRLISRGKVAGR